MKCKHKLSVTETGRSLLTSRKQSCKVYLGRCRPPVPQTLLLADDLAELPVEPQPACGAEEFVDELLSEPKELLDCDNVNEGEAVEDFSRRF
jgi:hypothetical protein